MANSKQEVEPSYNSDPEDSWSHCGIRRREASDDDGRSSEREERALWTGQRSFFGFDDELDGVGGAPDKEDERDEEVLYFDELEALREKEEVDEGFSQGEEELEEEKVTEVVKWRYKEEEEEKEEEKKALTVPRTGAFYMHDDRFGGRGSGRRYLH